MNLRKIAPTFLSLFIMVVPCIACASNEEYSPKENPLASVYSYFLQKGLTFPSQGLSQLRAEDIEKQMSEFNKCPYDSAHEPHLLDEHTFNIIDDNGTIRVECSHPAHAEGLQIEMLETSASLEFVGACGTFVALPFQHTAIRALICRMPRQARASFLTTSFPCGKDQAWQTPGNIALMRLIARKDSSSEQLCKFFADQGSQFDNEIIQTILKPAYEDSIKNSTA